MNKTLFFKRDDELDLLHDMLLDLAERYQWRLEAWAVFPNHYHFLAQSPFDPATLRKFITHLHASSSRKLNERLKYVMQNPVKHKIVAEAEQYKWCSINWFLNNATKAYRDSIMDLNTDDVCVIDDF